MDAREWAKRDKRTKEMKKWERVRMWWWISNKKARRNENGKALQGKEMKYIDEEDNKRKRCRELEHYQE